MTYQDPTDRELRRRIAKDLKRTDRVSGAARADSPYQCNCCVQARRTFWRGRPVFVVRLSRYWAMAEREHSAEALMMKLRAKASW